MKTTFKNHSELCHIFASQQQTTGNSGSLSFDGKKLLSYHWYCIGYIVNDDTILIRNDKYSNSTAKHISHLFRAVTHYKKIFVKYLPDRYYNLTDEIHRQNIDSFVVDINSCIINFKRSIKYKSSIVSQQRSMINDLITYCDLFNLPIPSYSVIDRNEAAKEILKQEERNKLIEQKKQDLVKKLYENASAELEQLQKDWVNNKTNKTYIIIDGRNYLHIPLSLRADNDRKIVQTSMGANVPYKEARVLYNLITAGKDIKGFKIGYYTVIGINGTLKIGCHEISREEISRFASSQNW